MKNTMDNKEQVAGWRSLSSESGIALVMVLVLAAMGLAIMAVLFYMLTASTQISGIQKRYMTAAEAGKGGALVIYKFIAERGIPDLTGIPIAASPIFTNVCMAAKLNDATYKDGVYNWTACGTNAADIANATTLQIDRNNPSSYDMSFDLGTGQPYRVYAKIVDTVQGNSGADLGLIKSGVVSANSGEVPAMSIPYLYTMEIDAENVANPQERAKYSILYQY